MSCCQILSESNKIYIMNESMKVINIVILTRWKNKEEFYREYHKKGPHKNQANFRPPIIGYKIVDLFQLFKSVLQRGGYDVVVSKRLWKHVYSDQKPLVHITNSTTSIKRHYEKCFLDFERYVVRDFIEKYIFIENNQLSYKKIDGVGKMSTYELNDILQYES